MFCWQKLHRWISNMVLQPTSMVTFSAKLIEIVKWFWFTCEGTFMTMENEHKTKLIFLKQCMPKGTDWFCIVCRVKILNYLKHIPVTRSSFATNSAQFQFYGSVGTKYPLCQEERKIHRQVVAIYFSDRKCHFRDASRVHCFSIFATMYALFWTHYFKNPLPAIFCVYADVILGSMRLLFKMHQYILRHNNVPPY